MAGCKGRFCCWNLQCFQWLLWECSNWGSISWRSWKTSSWLPGDSCHHVYQKWHQRDNWQESHWFLEKEYEAKLPIDVWTVSSFCPQKGLPILEIHVSDFVKYPYFLQYPMTMPRKYCACIPIESVVYLSPLSRWWLQWHPLPSNSLKKYLDEIHYPESGLQPGMSRRS